MSPNETHEARLARDARDRASEIYDDVRMTRARSVEARLEAEDLAARQQPADVIAHSQLETLRYSNGLREHRAGSDALDVGDILKRGGEEWEVLAVSADDLGIGVTLGLRGTEKG